MFRMDEMDEGYPAWLELWKQLGGGEKGRVVLGPGHLRVSSLYVSC